MGRTLGHLLAVVIFIAGAGIAHAGVVYEADGLAIGGYDPVAYFTDEKPVLGDPAHSLEWRGAVWRFKDAANKRSFEADPAKYAPRYGGYCAWAVSQGYTASTDPDAWSIVDGKLYLNYSKTVRLRWGLDKVGNIADADRNWPGLRTGLKE